MNEKTEELNNLLKQRIEKYEQLIRDLSLVRILLIGFTNFLVMLFVIVISFWMYGVLY